jgi:hypothetical protein
MDEGNATLFTMGISVDWSTEFDSPDAEWLYRFMFCGVILMVIFCRMLGAAGLLARRPLIEPSDGGVDLQPLALPGEV